MAHRRLVWVDVGMAVAVGGFIALVLFGRNSESFVPMMLGYMIAMVAWAFIAESAAIKAEHAEPKPRWEPAASTSTEPLPR